MKKAPGKRKTTTKRESFEELERLARDASDIRPLTADQRRQWKAAKRTGGNSGAGRPGRPRKDPRLKSKIVPISLDPALLEAADRYASAAGISRSRLVAEALKLRLSA